MRQIGNQTILGVLKASTTEPPALSPHHSQKISLPLPSEPTHFSGLTQIGTSLSPKTQDANLPVPNQQAQ